MFQFEKTQNNNNHTNQFITEFDQNMFCIDSEKWNKGQILRPHVNYRKKSHTL